MLMSSFVAANGRPRLCQAPAFRLVLTAILLTNLAAAWAETRELTPAERALVDRYSRIVGGVLDQFRSDDWVEKIDYTMDDPTTPVKPESPLQVGLLERTYNVRPASQRWTTLIEPYMKIVTGGNAAPQDMAKAGKTMQSLMHVHVSATFNVRLSALDLGHDTELKIAGVTRALRDLHPTEYDEPGVVLLFSGDDTRRWVKADGGLRFNFANRRERSSSRTSRFGSAAQRTASMSWYAPSTGVR